MNHSSINSMFTLCTGSVEKFRSGVQNRGLTLVELLIVLAILIGVSGMLTLSISNGISIRGVDGEYRTAEEVATLATMRTVRDALLGTSLEAPGYRGDVGEFPTRLGGLISNLDGKQPFHPSTKTGWRGPYIQDEGTRHGDFTVAGDGFPALPATDPAILDSWGKPILLQEPDTDAARLVSAGENRILETDLNTPVDANRGDDVVLFLLINDPNL